MILLNDVSYETEHGTVKDMSFHLHKGETVIILGPRRAGKSEFLKVCTGALPVTEGEVIINGSRVSSTDEHKTRDIGFVTQHQTLMDNLTIAANIGLPLSYHVGLKEEEMREMVLPLMAKFGISSLADRFPNDIASDESILAMMARAVVMKPSILVMDEPTAGDLDPEGFVRVVNMIKSFREEGLGMLISTCSPSLASLKGNTCYFFVNGRLIPYSHAAENTDPMLREYFKQIRTYTERQTQETTGFFRAIDMNAMLEEEE